MPNEDSIKMHSREARGVKRRHKLVEVARELFVERGYRKTTLRDIIARAGGSREMIYTAFGGKIGLLGTIVREAGEDFAAFITDPDALLLSPRQGLTRIALRLLDVWRSPEGRAVHRMVASEGAEEPDVLKAWYKGGTQPSLAALAQYFAVQTERGQFDIADPIAVARQFHMLILGEFIMPIIAGEEHRFDPDAAVERVVSLILRAYGRPSRIGDHPAGAS